MSVAMDEFPRRHRITVDEYHRMGELGLLARDARVELIEGEIIDMPPIGSRHATAVRRLNEILCQAVGPRAVVSCQLPVKLGDDCEPQPDFALLVPPAGAYASRHPNAADTLLVIEVSDSTAHYDLNTKMSLYAKHGVQELWIVDVIRKHLHIFRKPSGTQYEHVSRSESLGQVSIAALPNVTVDLSSLFR